MEDYDLIVAHKPGEAIANWTELCAECRKTQEDVLKGILGLAAGTEIGKRYSFADIDSIEAFQEKVPVLDYPDIEDYIERMADGEESLLFPGRTEYFISTSGTTGNSKKIPESSAGMRAKRAVLDLRNIYLAQNVIAACMKLPKFHELLARKGLADKAGDVAWLGTGMLEHVHFFSVTSATENRKTAGGIDIGFASGKTFENSPFTQSLAYPKELMTFADGDAVMYLTMLFALRYDDVTIITANNAARFYARVRYAQQHAEQIIADLRTGTIWDGLVLSDDNRALLESQLEPFPERADELQAILDQGRDGFVPKNYWPYVALTKFWLGGSVGVNVRKVKPLMPTDTLYFDVGYGASEAKINIPYHPNTVPGTLGITSAFYEFKPVDSDAMLTADQLEGGKDYEIFLTTYSGLYRYPLHDIVRVESFFQKTPDIEFITKSREILNIAQEKVPAPQAIDLLMALAKDRGLSIRQAQVFPNLDGQAYEVFVEFDDEEQARACDLDGLAVEFDQLLQERFELYGRNRAFRSLSPLLMHAMRQGWQDSLFAAKADKGIPTSQVKLAVMVTERPDGKWIL